MVMEKMKHGDVDTIKLSVNPFLQLMAVHVYFLDGVLIDTGPSIRGISLKRAFRSLDIQCVAITHNHEDHVGMAQWITKNFAAPVFCHEKALSSLNKKAHLPWYRALFSGLRPAFKATPYSGVIRTPHYELHPIETPGHTEDHVCLLEPNEGWLFTGDLYITAYPKVFSKEESMTSYIRTLEKVNKLDYETVFCAHEGVIPNGKERMKQKLDYLQTVREKVIHLHRRGYADKEIVKELFPKQVKLERMSFGSFSRLNLIRSCLHN